MIYQLKDSALEDVGLLWVEVDSHGDRVEELSKLIFDEVGFGGQTEDWFWKEIVSQLASEGIKAERTFVENIYL